MALHPWQTRGFQEGVLGFRSCQSGAFFICEDREAPCRSRNHQEQAQGRGGREERAGLPRDGRGVRDFRLLYLAIRGWKSHRQHMAGRFQHTCDDIAVGCPRHRPEGQRVFLRGFHHDLRAYASDRYGQRPCDVVLPLERTRRRLGWKERRWI